MQFLTAQQYYQQLLQQIPQAKKRIVIAAMIIQVDDATQPIFDAIVHAMQRGVEVLIVVDIYSKAVRPRRLNHRQFGHVWHQTSKTFARLRELGAQVQVVGHLGLNPTRHRCHIKITIIDDQVYSFGGVNLSAGSFQNIDYMLATKNAQIANTLDNLVQRIALGQPMIDFEQQLDQHTTLLFDAGKRRRSIIYDYAYRLAAQAARIYSVSQMVPSGRLARVIKRTENENYFNHPWQAAKFLAIALIIDKIRTGLKNSYHRPIYLHAKFILAELPGGKKALVSGSHNLSWRGVVYATKEIAIYSTDPKLWADLKAYVDTAIK